MKDHTLLGGAGYGGKYLHNLEWLSPQTVLGPPCKVPGMCVPKEHDHSTNPATHAPHHPVRWRSILNA